tara:strand:- start:4185 stop:4562 length:378 start_codon:yes stop_codon:yes gene_type:complete
MKITKSQLKQIIKEELGKVLSEKKEALNEVHPDNPFGPGDLVNCDKVRAMKEKLEKDSQEAYRWFLDATGDSVTRGSGANPSEARDSWQAIEKQIKYLKTAEHWQDCWKGIEKPFKGSGLGESKN